MDSEKFNNDPEFSWVLGEGIQGPRVISYREGGSRVIFSYPCRNKELFNIAAMCQDPRDQDAVGKFNYRSLNFEVV